MTSAALPLPLRWETPTPHLCFLLCSMEPAASLQGCLRLPGVTFKLACQVSPAGLRAGSGVLWRLPFPTGLWLPGDPMLWLPRAVPPLPGSCCSGARSLPAVGSTARRDAPHEAWGLIPRSPHLGVRQQGPGHVRTPAEGWALLRTAAVGRPLQPRFLQSVQRIPDMSLRVTATSLLKG